MRSPDSCKINGRADLARGWPYSGPRMRRATQVRRGGSTRPLHSRHRSRPLSRYSEGHSGSLTWNRSQGSGRSFLQADAAHYPARPGRAPGSTPQLPPTSHTHPACSTVLARSRLSLPHECPARGRVRGSPCGPPVRDGFNTLGSGATREDHGDCGEDGAH